MTVIIIIKIIYLIYYGCISCTAFILFDLWHLNNTTTNKHCHSIHYCKPIKIMYNNENLNLMRSAIPNNRNCKFCTLQQK